MSTSATKQVALGAQVQAVQFAITNLSVYWANRWFGKITVNGVVTPMSCARGRMIGGLVTDGLIPAAYASYLADPDGQGVYDRAAQDGYCPAL